MSNLLSQSHIQSYFPLFICLGTTALWNNITCYCHTIQLTEPFLQNLYSFDIMWLSYLILKRNFTDKQPTTWQQHEMGYSVFPGSDTLSRLEFLITYEKVTEEPECSAHTFPRRHLWVTCFLNLLLSSLKFTVHIAVVIVAFEVCACLCVGYESQKEREHTVGSHVHMFTCFYVCVGSRCKELNSDIRVSFSLWLTVCKHLHPLCWAAVTRYVLRLPGAAT